MCLGVTVCLYFVDIMRHSDVFGVTVCLYCVVIMRHSDVFGGYCLFVLC
jgi:hypothetical protein